MKISDRLEKIDSNFEVDRMHNGFVVKVRGRDNDNEWAECRIICTDKQQVVDLFFESIEMPLNE